MLAGASETYRLVQYCRSWKLEGDETLVQHIRANEELVCKFKMKVIPCLSEVPLTLRFNRICDLRWSKGGNEEKSCSNSWVLVWLKFPGLHDLKVFFPSWCVVKCWSLKALHTLLLYSIPRHISTSDNIGGLEKVAPLWFLSLKPV